MATFSVTANELKYASGSSWSSGKARQGVYSGTRYEGAINLAGLSGLDFSNIAVSQIQMRVTFGACGWRFDEVSDLLQGHEEQHLRQHRLHARRLHWFHHRHGGV